MGPSAPSPGRERFREKKGGSDEATRRNVTRRWQLAGRDYSGSYRVLVHVASIRDALELVAMKVAYADPPYIGQAKRHYGCPEVDHNLLIERLCEEYPDGWALSASSPTLREILNLCPADVRIGVWAKSFCAFKRGVRPAYAWEPVIYRGGRNPVKGYEAAIPPKNGKQVTPKDFIVAPITLKKGLVGAKPEVVCRWILDLLNVQIGDVVDDLFPGIGAMSHVAAEVTGQESEYEAKQEATLPRPNSTVESSLESDNCPHCGRYLRYGESDRYTKAVLVKDRDSGKVVIQCPACGKEDPR